MILRPNMSAAGVHRVVMRLAFCIAIGLACTTITTVVALRYAESSGYSSSQTLEQLTTPADEPGRVVRWRVRHDHFFGGCYYSISSFDVVVDGAHRDLAPPIMSSDLPDWVDRPQHPSVGVSATGFGEPFVCAATNADQFRGFYPSNLVEPTPRPVWSGIALTTMLWAGIWYAVLLAAAAIRRRRRARRGLCPACAYDLRGAPTPICPECGQGIHTDIPTDVSPGPTSPAPARL